MSSEKNLFQVARPMAKEHESIERRLYTDDKKQFGGMYYTDKARKLHIAVVGSNSRLVDQLTEKDVFFHRVKHTWETMNEVQAAANTLFGRYGIHMAGFEPEKNQIFIGVDALNDDTVQAIAAEMAGFGFADRDMYCILEKPRIEGFRSPDDGDETESGKAERLAVSDGERNPDPGTNGVTTIMPGGMILVEDSSGNFIHLCSVNYGYVYNNKPYLAGAGHAGSATYVGRDAYYVPPITGYPISSVPVNYNIANRVKIGTVALQRLGGNYDLRTIRITENNLAFTHTAYNGHTITNIGGNITQGAVLRVCGITSRYDADYEFGYCSNAQISLSAYGTTMTNLMQLDFGANNGTSGGPVITQDADGSIRLVGLASVNGAGTCYAVPIRYMISTYNLSELPEGAITV